MIDADFYSTPHLRPARADDAAFAWRVSDACIKPYAEQTWGYWDGDANFDPARDEIVTHLGWNIGVMRVDRLPDHWFLAKLYLLPPFQGEGLGSLLLEQLIADAATARMPLRLTVLEVNPALRFYERHGFVVTDTVPPRHHMELADLI
jgi:GNAT superfamily N-acetyltransferase